MASINPFGGEGNSINRPPVFNGEGYAYWKVRMRIFIEAIDVDIWDSIENGSYTPQHLVDGEVKTKPRSLWTDDEKKKVQNDLKAKNIITSALSYDEFFRVSQCTSAKEMWDTLQVTHEGTSEVKRARLNALTHEYELFRMLPNESISDLQKRFTHIVNHLVALDKKFSKGELTNKVLRCLDRKWQPKVTAIVESRDVDSMTLATLFGKLQEHEMELGRLSLHEESDRKKKGISLKATTSTQKSHDEQSSEDDSDEEVDDETMALLVRRFSKFLKRKGGWKNFNKSTNPRETTKKSKSSRDKIICHECKKPGHIKFSCPQYLRRVENEKKENKDNKGKRAYIVWDTPEDQTSTSSSEDEECANLCLMTKTHDEASSSQTSSMEGNTNEVSCSNSTSNNSIEHDDDVLYNAYCEMHKQLKKVVNKNIKRKEIIDGLQLKVLNLENELNELRLENETLDLIYSSASCLCAHDEKVVTTCEKCIVLEKENLELKEKLASFTRGKNHLNNILENQRHSNSKHGLGYRKSSNKSRKRKVGKFIKSTKSRKPTCFYCGELGHTTNVCYARMFGVPNGELMWLPKGQRSKTCPRANPKGPKVTWVPKTTK